MKSIIVLQARTDSSRLPAKVLLPLAGMPVVVLAALRAGNRGRKLIVVTSDNKTDDLLCRVLAQQQLSTFRGGLNNVLKRFVDALVAYSDDTIVIRLTADNVFPDGELIDRVEREFHARELEYIGCCPEQSGLPYGTSVEITRLKHLREANLYAVTDFDKEHVTPYIIRKFGSHSYMADSPIDYAPYRSTVDYFSDYLTIDKVFSKIDEPVSISYLKLMEKLRHQSDVSAVANGSGKLIIGSASFDSVYGINNAYGRPEKDEISDILTLALQHNVKYVDTARAYGNSENILGELLTPELKTQIKLITKLDCLKDLSDSATEEHVFSKVELSIMRSCYALRVQSLDVLLLHRARHLLCNNGYIWKKILMMKQEGFIKTTGVSVQTPDELDLALDFEDVELIQLPYNILDNRWHGYIDRIIEAKKRRHLIIHSRSCFLQGLLMSADYKKWEQAGFKEYNKIQKWLKLLMNKYKKKSIHELCTAYVQSQKWIDGIVVGVETVDQLRENLYYFNHGSLPDSGYEVIHSSRPDLNESSLNPACWVV